MIATLLTSILKMIRLSDKLTFSRNDSSKFAFSRNNNSKLAFKKNDSNDKINGFDVGRNDIKHTKKSEKLSKLENLSISKKLKSKKFV